MRPEYLLIATLLALPIALTLLMYALHWALDKWGYPNAIRAFKAMEGLTCHVCAAPTPTIRAMAITGGAA